VYSHPGARGARPSRVTLANRQASAASAHSLLGDLASGIVLTEFDLFNGELLDSDHDEGEEEDEQVPTESHRDTF
jgi:hypothetical protein